MHRKSLLQNNISPSSTALKQETSVNIEFKAHQCHVPFWGCDECVPSAAYLSFYLQ